MPSPSESPEPASLIAAVARRYADLRSYRDKGECVTSFSNSPYKAERRFRTEFVRPDRFRFEFRERPGRSDIPEADWTTFVAWMSGGVAHSWWTLKPVVETRGTIFDCLLPAAGISRRTSMNVPGLLLPGRPVESVFPETAAIATVTRTKIDSVDCVRIDRAPAPDRSMSWWIVSNSLLLLRSEEIVRYTKERQRKLHEGWEQVLVLPVEQGGLTEKQKRLLSERPPKPRSEYTAHSVTTYRPAADVEIEPDAFTKGLPSSV